MQNRLMKIKINNHNNNIIHYLPAISNFKLKNLFLFNISPFLKTML